MDPDIAELVSIADWIHGVLPQVFPAFEDELWAKAEVVRTAAEDLWAAREHGCLSRYAREVRAKALEDADADD
jgi:hypothetical protein